MPSRDLHSCRADFPALARIHAGNPIAFLDGPAGSQMPERVIEAIGDYYRTSNANTHGFFPTSRETDALMASARGTVATFLGCDQPTSISFGASMTTLTFSLSRALARGWKEGDEVVVTALDHEANRGPWLRLEDDGIRVREVGLDPDGRLNAADLERAVTERTRLVAIGLASNALGTVNDLPLARRLSSEAGALLAVDAVHYAPHFAIDVAALDVDFLLCSAYKFYGPHVGVLYSRPGLLETVDADRLRTQDQTAPYRIETGTLNHAAIAGVAAAIEYIAGFGDGEDLRGTLVDAFARIGEQEREIAGHLWSRFGEIPGVTRWGPDFSERQRAPTMAITLDGLRPQEAAAKLGDQGLQVWDGDFYAIRAIESLGLADTGGVLRTGVLMYNTMEEVDRLADAVTAL
ncbi:MAG: cysteine desulfurase-like protein [Thermoanaerobaculia bacterium]